nr:hypothetical protein [Allomuricauda sp.]
MKPFILILFFAIGQSCSNTDNLGLNENDQVQGQQEQTNQDTNTDLPDQEMIGPNELRFTIKLLSEMQGDKEICGSAKKYVFDVEVLEILESGGSITQKLAKNQELKVAFLFDPGALEANSTLEAKARESLCEDTSTTYFTVLAHKILE